MMKEFCQTEEKYLEHVSGHVREVLEAIGENPEREGLQDTPKRVAKMYREVFGGYCAEDEPKITVFENEEKYDEMIVDEGYFYSMCEHHMVPFFGKSFIAYIPDKKIIGLSKLNRIVDFYAQRLQVQERLTQQIAAYLMKILEPKGVAVVLQARHLCREMRGVKKFNANMTTNEMLGAFRNNSQTRQEFMGVVHQKLD